MKTPCSWQRGTKHTVLRCDMGRLALRYGAFCDAIRPVSHRFHLYIYLFYRHLADVLGNEALHYHCISTIDYLTIKPLRLHAHFRAICGQRLCSFAGRESRKPFVPRCLTFLTIDNHVDWRACGRRVESKNQTHSMRNRPNGERHSRKAIYPSRRALSQYSITAALWVMKITVLSREPRML